MINLQKRRDYEASLNNILHKAPMEAGVERVVITLLNDILDDLGKWPELSAEDTPNFGGGQKTDWYSTIRQYYGLHSGDPDGMILDDSVTYQQAKDNPGDKLQPHALIEVKDLGINQNNVAFTGSGANTVIQELENDPNTKDIIKEILNIVCKLKIGQSEQFKDKWEVEVLSHKGTDYPIEIRDSSKTVASLHQLDIYLLDLYACDNINYVIWTNGLCWKIWKKDASGNIDLGKPDFDTKAQLGYVKNNNVQIDPNEFNALINYLHSIL